MQRCVAHTRFVIERIFAAPPGAVFHAWADLDAKLSWSDCHSQDDSGEHTLDFRPGGRELHRMHAPDGGAFTVAAHYFDIIPDERIIYAYEILADERRLSASLVTVEFTPQHGGTRMLYTEQVAFLDGHQDAEERIRGTEEGLDRLVLMLTAGTAQ